MAYSYQVSVAPGVTTLADMVTTRGGAAVTILADTTDIYIGGDENQLKSNTTSKALTTSTGFKLAAGAAYSTVLDGNEVLYAISSISTVTVTAYVFRSNSRT